MKKRILSMLLCLCLLVGFMPLQTLAAESIVTGGTWGGIDWTLDADGTLTITPTDKVITDYKHGNKTELYERGQVPCGANLAWTDYYTPWTKADVKKLVIQEGVTSIGTFAFMGLDNLTGEVVIPSTVVYIGQEAIKSTKLNKITFAEGGTGSLTIAQGGLNNNAYLEEVVFPADRPEIHLKAWILNSCDSLTHLFFPANVKSVNGTNNLDYKNFSSSHSAGNHSALTYYCDNLETITFGSEAVKDLYFNWGNPITTIGTKSSYTTPKTAAFAGLTYGTSVQAVADMAKPGETVKLNNDCADNIVLPFSVMFDPNSYEFTGNIVNAPADPTAQNEIVYGAKLSAVGLPDGWMWADTDTVPTVDNAGYTAYYTPADTANYDWTGIEGWNAETNRVERKVAVSVAKADITYTAPTVKSGLIYTGGAQMLVTAGSATGGEMQYAIGSAEQVTGEWSTDVPTGTDIGTYYVWYKVVGDRNHNDKTFETPIAVTIAPNTYIVTPAPTENGRFTVKVGDDEATTAAAGETVTITASPAENYAVNTVTVKDASNNDVAVTDNGDGTYSFTMPASYVTVSVTFKILDPKVASVTFEGTTTSYTTIDAAWAAAIACNTTANEKATITLLDSCATADTLTNTEDYIVLDTNGKTLTCNHSRIDANGICNNGGSLEVIGNGKVTSNTAYTTSDGVLGNTEGTLIIDGAWIYNSGNNTSYPVVNKGEFHFVSGKLQSNENMSGEDLRALMVRNGGTAYMYSGTLIANTNNGSALLVSTTPPTMGNLVLCYSEQPLTIISNNVDKIFNDLSRIKVSDDIVLDITYGPNADGTGTTTVTNQTEISNEVNASKYLQIKTKRKIAITAEANPANGGTVTGSGSYGLGTTATLTATPATGYSFVNWTENGTEVSTDATYSFTATENAEYVANFEEYHTHCVCGATHAAIGTHITEENPTWIAISSASDFTKNKDSGYYYLTNDIEVSAKWDFTKSRDIVLCLNGYDITYTGSSNVSFIPGSTTLNFTLTDCQDDAGSISGFKNTYGGAINVKKAFTMYNGKITGNTANQGGGVYVDQNATFYMYGGEITGNTAASIGGGVFSKGSVEVAGAPVVNNNESSNTATTYPSSMYKYTKNIYSSTGAIRVGTGGLATGALLDVTPMFPASSSEKPAAVAVIATGCTSDLSEYFTYTSGFDYIKQYDAAKGEVQLVYNPVKYIVTFDMQGHGTQIEPQEVETGTYALEPTPAPTAVGYQFGGWYTTPECGYWDDFIFDFLKITANTTLYAKWTEKATVSISEDVQAYTWDGNAKAFIISGNPDTNFVVQYKVNDNWTEAAPSAMGTYDVKITREEDTIYKAYEKMIGGGLVINAATPTVTVPTVEADLVYDGTSQSLIAEGTSENGHWEYSLDGTNYLTTVPAGTDAKTYTVYCNFVPNAGYAGVDPVELSVTIDPMAVDEPTVNDSYIYTGSKQTVTLNGFNDSYMTIAGNKETNAGDYEVVITLDSNHTWNTGSDGRVQWSIGKAEPTVTWPTGTAYVNDTSVTLTGGSAAGVGTETSVEGSFTLEAVDLTSAGTKTVKITFAPNSTNYKNVEKTDYSVTVSKRTVESVAEQTAVENAVYGTEQDALGLPASVEITVSGNKMFTVPVTWSGYDATSLNAQTLTGTLDLTDIAAEVQQPNPAITAAIVVDLQEKNAAAFSFENKTETYSGSPISYEISGGLDGVASISYSYESSEYAASSTAPTNAGVYEVTAIFTMEAGYASVAPKTATLTITPKEVGLDWAELSAAELVYNGTAKTLTSTATALVVGDSCTVTVELVGDNVNAGTFSYKATALSNANYKLPPNISSPEYTITPKTLTITADDKEVYVGNDQPELTYTVEGLVGSDVLITAPTLRTDANMYNAGTYAITFANEAAAGNNYSITYVNGALTVKNHPYSPTITPIYDVKIADDITGGEVSASRKLAYKGTTITITIAPDAGYELAKLIVTDSRGNAVAVTKASDNTYTFKMPASKITVKAAFAVANPFEDVSSDAYYYDAVLWAVKVGITSGTGATTFSPDNPCTRAQMATFLWRAAGSPDPVSKTCIFADVPADAYYATAVQWAYEQGITSGISATTYSPDNPCTRAQMATFLWRNAGSPDPVSKTCIFADVPADAYYATAVQWAYEQGITSGTSATTFSPNDPCTRGQMVTFLYRYYVK